MESYDKQRNILELKTILLDSYEMIEEFNEKLQKYNEYKKEDVFVCCKRLELDLEYNRILINELIEENNLEEHLAEAVDWIDLEYK